MAAAIDHRSPAFLTLFEVAPCGLLLTDAAGIILNVNPAACHMLGYRPEELIDRGVWMLTPDPVDVVKRNIQHVLAGNRIQHEVINLTRNGEPRRLMLRQNAINLSDGRQGILIASVDITDRRQTESALVESQSKHRSLFQTSLDGIVYADLDGVIIEANPAFCQMFGYTAEQLKGMHARELTSPKWRRQQNEVVAQLLSRGHTDLHEREYVRSNGEAFPVSIRAWLDRDEQGRPLRMFAVARDISEQARAERELRSREAESRQLSQRLQSLLREMDHRVKNNMANLYALVDLYARSADSVDDLADAIRDKLSAMRWVHSVVASSGWRSIALDELMRRIAEQFDSPDHAAKQLRIDGPPVEIPPRQIAALAMIFQELFANAFEHGSGGHIDIRWQTLDDTAPPSRIRITWQESGNDSIRSPATRGVGLGLIEGFARFELQGSCDLVFDPPGLRCTLECRLDEPDNQRSMLDLVFD